MLGVWIWLSNYRRWAATRQIMLFISMLVASERGFLFLRESWIYRPLWQDHPKVFLLVIVIRWQRVVMPSAEDWEKWVKWHHLVCRNPWLDILSVPIRTTRKPSTAQKEWIYGFYWDTDDVVSKPKGNRQNFSRPSIILKDRPIWMISLRTYGRQFEFGRRNIERNYPEGSTFFLITTAQATQVLQLIILKSTTNHGNVEKSYWAAWSCSRILDEYREYERFCCISQS